MKKLCYQSVLNDAGILKYLHIQRVYVGACTYVCACVHVCDWCPLVNKHTTHMGLPAIPFTHHTSPWLKTLISLLLLCLQSFPRDRHIRHLFHKFMHCSNNPFITGPPNLKFQPHYLNILYLSSLLHFSW